jgi:competence protein ComGC
MDKNINNNEEFTLKEQLIIGAIASVVIILLMGVESLLA